MDNASRVTAVRIAFRDEARASDRAAVERIVERTGFFRPDEVAIAVELVDESLAKGVASGYHFVFADVEDVVAGYACFGSIPCTASSFDMYWVAVDPNLQGQGIGRQLMAAVESRIRAAGGERVYVDTSGREQYAPTRAFYERCGYHDEARQKDFYAAGDDRIIYVKALT